MRLDEIDGTDLFCGGGGSTEGLEQVYGIRVRQAINHWRQAVDTHQRNHPHANHDCADISQVDPRRYARTTIAWISPDCTKHVKARGVKRDVSQHTSAPGDTPLDAAERSRATMWDVVRFAEFHDYEAIIVENVVEATQWGRFPAWLMAMTSMGYQVQMVYASSAHVGGGAATNRNRWFAVFTKVGAPVPDVAKWTSPHATCPSCGFAGRLMKHWKKGNDAAGGVYGAQYLWHCGSCDQAVRPPIQSAASIVDWSLPALGVLDGRRRTPVVDRTLFKIGAGLLDTAVEGMAVPFIVELRGGGSLWRAITEPLSTITAKGNHHGLIIPPGWNPETGRGSVPAASLGMEQLQYRILSVEERKVASAFPAQYALLGTGEEQVRMIGNAVTPNMARALGSAVLEALTGAVLDEQQWSLAA